MAKKLFKNLKSENKNCGGPDEIRTHDPRRVKARQIAIFKQNRNAETRFNSLNKLWSLDSDSFKEWLNAKDVSKITKRDYYNSLTRFFGATTITRPQDFRTLKLKDKEERGLRNLFNYCEDEDIDDVAGYSIHKWRRYVKIKKSGVSEIYVTDDEIRNAFKNYPEDLMPVYQLLLYSGNRLTHIHQMLKNFDERNIIVDGDIAHYPTSSFSSGTKRTFHVFFPASFVPILKSIKQIYGYDHYLKKIRRGRVSAKTIRKWHLNMMVSESVNEGTADFIQGRAPATVGNAHYLNKVKHAKEAYKKIIWRFDSLETNSTTDTESVV
jgi:intergrase/recombinase